MLKKISITLFVFSTIFMVKNAFNNASLPNAGFSGAPGESTCAVSGCHTGVVQINSNVVNFSFFPVNNPRPVSYQQNTVYNFIVNFPLVQPSVAGFLVTALDANNNNAGTFQIVSANNTDTLTDGITGRKYIGHKNATSTSAWIFRWLSPVSCAGKVTFYCAALGADGNNLSTNDITYVDSIQFPSACIPNFLQAGFTISQNSACVNEIVSFTSTSTGPISSYLWNFGSNATPPTAVGIGPHNVAYSTSGNKTINLQISDGVNMDSVSTNFRVDEIPVADAGNDITICSGDTAFLNASGNGIFLWSNGATSASIQVLPIVNTTYTVTVNNNGCIDTDEVSVFVSPKPIVNLSNQNLCAGSSLNLDAGNVGSTYFWSTSETTKTISVNSGGTFTVTVTNANNCVGIGSAVVNLVNSLSIGLSDTLEICAGENALLDAGNPGAMYNWSANATTQTISVSAQNTYRVTVTDANGCSGVDSVFLKVNQNPVITLNDTAICNGETLVLDAGNSGAAFLWSTQETTQSISISPRNLTILSVKVTQANGCFATDSIEVAVGGIRADDVVVCRGDTAELIAMGGTDFLWSTQETSAIIQVFTLDTISLVLTGTVIGNCNAVDTVTIFPVEAANVSFLLPDSFCANEQINLEDFVSPIGGTFTGMGVSGAQLDLMQVQVGGPFPISYSVFDTNGCGAFVVQHYNVKLAPAASLVNLKSSYCSNENIERLEGLPTGGVFSGNGISGNLFVPFFAGSGPQIIQYIFESANGCVAIDSDTVEVHKAPKVLFFMPQISFCSNDDSILLEALPKGGIFEGLGVVDSFFFPALAGGSNPLAISYTFVDSHQCQSVAVNTVEVLNAATISFSTLKQQYCLNEGLITLNALPQGGTFVGNGVSNNQIDITALGIGNHDLQYVFVNPENCVSTSEFVLTVNDTPSITAFELIDKICSNETSIILEAEPAGGIFTGAGVVGGAFFNPSLVAAGGPFDITYTLTDNNQCQNTVVRSLFVNQAPNIILEPIGSKFCSADFFNTPITLSPQGGKLSGAGIIGETFVPGLAGVGTHIIRYEFLSANDCFDFKDIVVEVENCSGIEDKILGNINAYPNPFQSFFSLKFEHSFNDLLQVKIFTLLGEKVFEQNYTYQTEIRVAPNINLSEGRYFMQLIHENSNLTIPLQKQN